MSKYRLCYLGYGGYKSIDLSKLECLKGFKVTDIKVIDDFTTNFESEEELIEYLKKNGLIDSSVKKISITVDKKENNNVINKKIYNGEKLMFKNDKKYLNASYIYQWLINNRNDYDAISIICDNYINKYKNAYNRIDGSSFILGLFTSILNLAIKLKNNKESMSLRQINEYNDSISDFIDLEFYKIDKEKLKYEGKIVKKKDSDGKYLKSYRNIHDFINVLKEHKLDLENIKDFEELQKEIKSNINVINKPVEEEKEEEFLTPDEIKEAYPDTFDEHPHKM